MAQVANTYETFDAVGIREELADKIWMQTPEETPFLSLIGRKGIKTTHPEWQIDTLGSVDLNNNQPEGNDWTYDSITPTTRVGNYAQISEKSVIISTTLDETDKAGRKSELAREVGKKVKELKIDMEAIAMSNQAALAGSGDAATNRKSAGFRAWIVTNDSVGGGGGASGSFSNGIQGAATNGTQRALTKALMDEVVLSTANAGGKANVFMMSNYNKTVASRFLDDADIVPLRKELGKGQATIVGAADAYLTDFGLKTFVPNVQMTRAGSDIARNVFLIDASMVELGMFRDIAVHKPAKTGDAEKRVLNVEWTLIVNNEAAHGVVADTYGLTSAT
jgi:hypothetical protein